MKSRKAVKKLRAAMAHAESYEVWQAAARELDRVEGHDDWKHDDTSNLYDYLLIKRRLRDLRRLRQENRVQELVFALNEGMHRNLGNLSNPALYDVSHCGTKKLVQDYLDEVCNCLNYLCDGDFSELQIGDKFRFFRNAGQCMGRSALMLSGGATLGLFHIGVVKSLWSADLLPRVFSGSSAGSVIASVACTRTESEFEELMEPDGIYLRAFRRLDMKGMLQQGGLMDSRQLERNLLQNISEITFEEAFAKTGRILNISVSPADAHQQGRVLNYLHSPHALVHRASLASCAIPLVFAPVELRAKNFKGRVVPYMPGRRWVDGSMRADLPMLRVSRMHNVNHYIVSQTNPHVVPFMKRKQRRKGVVNLGTRLTKAAYQAANKQVAEYARDHLKPSGIGGLVEKFTSLTSQRYSGDINLYPRHTVGMVARALTNPNADQVMQFIDSGERATWPRIDQIRNATAISATIETCLQRLKATADESADPATVRQYQRLD